MKKPGISSRYLLVLSAGHAFTDMNQGALPAILPYLVAAGGLKYAEVAGLTFAVSLFSSMLQPIFGIMADRSSRARLLPFGVLLGGCGLSLVGFFPDKYWLMFAAAVVSGIGVAAYHPEAARMANRMAGEKKGSGMSIFSVGGNIGFTIGPMLATPALIYIGLRGSVILAIPAIVMFFVFIRMAPAMHSRSSMGEEGGSSAPGALKNEWGKFLWLGIAIIARSIISQNINTFLPLYWINELGQSGAQAGMAISFMFFCGAAATVMGGYLADRIGIKNILRIGWLLLIPALFFFTRITNTAGAWLILVPLAFGLNMINTPAVLLGQKYLPANIGFASGITMGLGVSIGGLTAPLLGNYADLHGLAATLRLLCILPFAGALVALTIKQPRAESGG